MIRIGSFATVLAVALSGCGNEPTSTTEILRAQSAVLTGGESSEPFVVTRASIAEVPVPLQLVTIESRNQKAFFTEVEQNSGVETWESPDGLSISLRNGVLIATRGMGGDLMVGSGQRPVLQKSADAQYSRDYVHLSGLDQTERLAATCSSRSEGRKTVEIVEKNFVLNEITETCVGKGIPFSNSYWVDGSGRILKSRQWVGPDVGSVVIENLRE